MKPFKRSSKTQTSAPSVEPVTVAEAKAHMRVDHSTDDTLIGNLIKAAREHCEHSTGRALITQTWESRFDYWPSGGVIYVPKPPLQSVTSIVYIDTAGASTTLSASVYDVDTNATPGRILPAYNESWPSVQDHTNVITVTYVAGFGDAASDVPEGLRIAILQLVAQWYEHREAISAGISTADLPFAVDSLFRLHEVHGAQ